MVSVVQNMKRSEERSVITSKRAAFPTNVSYFVSKALKAFVVNFEKFFTAVPPFCRISVFYTIYFMGNIFYGKRTISC
jgi:hypothetical protein